MGPATNDFGVDVIAIDGYRKTRLAIQCKRHNLHSTVGVKAVMEGSCGRDALSHVLLRGGGDNSDTLYEAGAGVGEGA